MTVTSILYDRLSVVPPSPNLGERQPLPPVQSGTGMPSLPLSYPPPPPPPHHKDTVDNAHTADPNDHTFMDYMRNHPNSRSLSGSDGRPLMLETPVGPAVAPPAHGMPMRTSSRSSGGHDSSRQLPPLPHAVARGMGDDPLEALRLPPSPARPI